MSKKGERICLLSMTFAVTIIENNETEKTK